MLEAAGLECVRGERTLFSQLDFRVEPVTLLRVAGPNGTGNTSLLKLVCGLLSPAAGEIRWQGENNRRLHEEYRSHLLYLGHLPAVKDDLTVLENLHVACAVAGRPVTDVRGPRGARRARARRVREASGLELRHTKAISYGTDEVALVRVMGVLLGERGFVLREPFFLRSCREGLSLEEYFVQASMKKHCWREISLRRCRTSCQASYSSKKGVKIAV